MNARPALDPLLSSADAEHAEVFLNRPGLGTHRAVLRGWLAPTTPCWALPHLLRVLGTGAADHDAAWFADDDLLEPLRRRRGLPLGNLVSQTVANLHLAPLDDWLREHPAVAGFVRYVDDIFVFGADRAALREVMAGASDILGGLRLRLARSHRPRPITTTRRTPFTTVDSQQVNQAPVLQKALRQRGRRPNGACTSYAPESDLRPMRARRDHWPITTAR